MLAGFDVKKDDQIAYTLLRVVVGINLMMHGVSRMLAGPAAFAAKLTEQFTHTPLPLWSVRGFGLILPFCEGVLGLLLLIGLRTRAALIGSGILIAVLTFGSALMQDWAAAATQLVYALIFSILLFLRRYNGFSVDAWMERE